MVVNVTKECFKSTLDEKNERKKEDENGNEIVTASFCFIV
jgi:hypothetical protein